MARFAIEEIRQLGEIDIFCGLRRLTGDESVQEPFVLDVDAPTLAALEYQIRLHLNCQNYDDFTTRVLAVIVGQAKPAKLFRVSSNGQLDFVRKFEAPILFVEIAGDAAIPANRTQFDDRILLYEPEVAAKPTNRAERT